MPRKFVNRKNICAALAMVLGLTILTSASQQQGRNEGEKTEVASTEKKDTTRQKL